MEPITAELTIEGFSERGFGLAPAPSGKAQVEVAHAICGDRVKVQLFRKKRRVQKGRLLELLAASSDRIEAKCRHAFLCGGCTWQTMAYEKQLLLKQEIVFQSFKGLIHSGVELRQVIACEEPFGYRNKMEFSFSENRAGDKFLGLMIAHAEPYVFNVEQCELAPSWMSECLGRVRQWWMASNLAAYFAPKDTGTLRYLTLREGVRTGQKMAVLNVSGHPDFAPTQANLDAFVEAVGKDCSIFLRVHQTKKGTPTQFFEMHLAGKDHIVEELHLASGPLRFKISPSSFFQPNTKQAEKLYDAVLRAIPTPCKTLFDLYCGTGTLAMAASSKAETVLGIELNTDAVLDAEENAALNNRTNVSFLKGDVGKMLTTLSVIPSAVIVDPPRAGLDEQALSHLKQLSPQRIIYVSCNPRTQAENVKNLIEAGYRLQSMQMIDQFPHTAHIEHLAVLLTEGVKR